MALERAVDSRRAHGMTGHVHGASDMAVAPAAVMWLGMMAAMMAPTAWPWMRAYHRFGVTGRGGRVASTVEFGAGYLVAWSGYAIAAALLQRALLATSLMQRSGDAVIAPVGGVIFLIAGLYQFAPLKHACLTHCRTPMGYFLTRWIDGPASAFRMGLHHGLFCVGCCWALMATAFAVGVMSTWWMVASGAAALGEQVAPHGHVMRRALGAALVLAGVYRLVTS